MDLTETLRRHQVAERAIIELLAISTETMRLWKLKRRHMRPQHVLAIEAEFGIPRHELRPDIYPPPAAERPAA